MTIKRVQATDVSPTGEGVMINASYNTDTGVTDVLSVTKISVLRREFKNWIIAVRLLKWLKRHPHCEVFDLDNEVFNTRVYTGRQG